MEATTETNSQGYHGSVDDGFRAVLEGLRTTLPGTQALFGFLLILPFQPRFSDLAALERGAYYVAFISAAVATALLTAPSVHQRLRAPRSGVQRHSAVHLRIAVWITIAGSVVLAIGLVAAVFMVSRVIFSNTAAGLAAGGVTLITFVVWFYLPLVTFNRIE